jgi:oxygen-independent coproporphyrinogen-3 oxidase
MDIEDNGINKEIFDITRLFGYTGRASVTAEYSGGALNTVIKVDGKEFRFTDIICPENPLDKIRLKKRHAKKHLYDVLKELTGISPPWGCVTGIRPVKLYSQIIDETGEAADDYLLNFFDIKKDKLKLLKQIYRAQQKYLIYNPKAADLYVGIPFCKGRCSYCSFFSADIEKNRNLIDDYINCLIKEIECAKSIINDKGIKVSSVYVGGGTPTSIGAERLNALLNALKGIEAREFTVEAGRPDSISAEILDVLRENGVNRICINPQTANEKTLKLIGRAHTVDDLFKAFALAAGYDFTINADIIAGLPQETAADFKNTVDTVIKLNPHNVTVHTLALKRGSRLNESDYRHIENAGEMLGYASSQLNKNGYYAYYMYKQKKTAGELENVGYAKSGFECLYNINNLSDFVDVMACGANSISKRIFGEGRIERLDTPKDIPTYCGKIDGIIQKKREFFN